MSLNRRRSEIKLSVLQSCAPAGPVIGSPHTEARDIYCNSRFSYIYLDSPTQVITILCSGPHAWIMAPPHVLSFPCRCWLRRVEITSRLAMPGSSSLSLLLSALQTVLLKQCCFTLLLHKSIFVRTNRPGQFRLTCQSIFLHCIRRILMKIANARIFQVVFTFMAIQQRNTIQIIGLVIFNACFVAYSAVQVLSLPFVLFWSD